MRVGNEEQHRQRKQELMEKALRHKHRKRVVRFDQPRHRSGRR